MVSNLQFQTLHYNQPQHPAKRLLGGSKNIVTLLFPHAGQINRPSALLDHMFA